MFTAGSPTPTVPLDNLHGEFFQWIMSLKETSPRGEITADAVKALFSLRTIYAQAVPEACYQAFASSIRDDAGLATAADKLRLGHDLFK